MLVRGGWVLTLGERTQNHTEADVLIEDGRIAGIGSGLRARDAEEVDATGCIVMPGFVDTHRHVWKSLFRNLGHERPDDAAGPHHTPDDIYAATLIGLLGAVEAGITSVVDWSDVQADDTHTEAALQAHADAGLRTVLVHATPAWGPAAPPGAAAAVRAAAGAATTVAYGAPTPSRAGLDAVGDDWSAARQAGLRIHAHAGLDPAEQGVVADLGAGGLLGADVTLVHCSHAGDADLDAVASSGTSVAVTPASEMAGGLGAPPLQRLLDRGIRPGLGVDDEQLGPGDIFAQLRAVISVQHATYFDAKLAGKAGLPNLLTTREVIRYATVDGARAAGLGDVAGSLEVGKQADLVVLRADRPNIWPINDAIGAVVWGMDTSNVDWVIIGGRSLMRHGVLDADVTRARHLAMAARERVASAAGLLSGATPGGVA